MKKNILLASTLALGLFAPIISPTVSEAKTLVKSETSTGFNENVLDKAPLQNMTKYLLDKKYKLSYNKPLSVKITLAEDGFYAIGNSYRGGKLSFKQEVLDTKGRKMDTHILNTKKTPLTNDNSRYIYLKKGVYTIKTTAQQKIVDYNYQLVVTKNFGEKINGVYFFGGSDNRSSFIYKAQYTKLDVGTFQLNQKSDVLLNLSTDNSKKVDLYVKEGSQGFKQISKSYNTERYVRVSYTPKTLGDTTLRAVVTTITGEKYTIDKKMKVIPKQSLKGITYSINKLNLKNTENLKVTVKSKEFNKNIIVTTELVNKSEDGFTGTYERHALNETVTSNLKNLNGKYSLIITIQQINGSVLGKVVKEVTVTK